MIQKSRKPANSAGFASRSNIAFTPKTSKMEIAKLKKQLHTDLGKFILALEKVKSMEELKETLEEWTDKAHENINDIIEDFNIEPSDVVDSDILEEVLQIVADRDIKPNNKTLPIYEKILLTENYRIAQIENLAQRYRFDSFLQQLTENPCQLSITEIFHPLNSK